MVKCLRVEDSVLWETYAKRRAAIRQENVPVLDFEPQTYKELPYSALSTRL